MKAAFHLLRAARLLIKKHQLLRVEGPPTPAGLMGSCGGLLASSAPGQAALRPGARAGQLREHRGGHVTSQASVPVDLMEPLLPAKHYTGGSKG